MSAARLKHNFKNHSVRDLFGFDLDDCSKVRSLEIFRLRSVCRNWELKLVCIMNWNFRVNCIIDASPDGCLGPCEFLTPVIVMHSFRAPPKRSARSALELETFVQANIFMKPTRQDSF